MEVTELELSQLHAVSVLGRGEVTELELSQLHAVSVLGRGAKGVVFIVNFNNQTLALKAISKSFIEKKHNTKPIQQDAYRRIWFERDVLSSLRHPLLPSLHAVVSTDKILGFAISLCSGGDLAALRRRQTEHMFSDEIIKFYAAELVLALEHLHKLGIVYRDLKPENILIQESGHIMLVDFDLSVKLPPKNTPNPPPDNNPKPDPTKRRSNRRWFGCFSINSFVSPEISDSNKRKTVDSPQNSDSGKSNSFVGTEEYVAPEIIKGSGHDYAVDWWSLGVVLYEMLYGRTPFRGQKSRKETFYRILTREAELVGEKTALRDLIGALLEKDSEKRINCEGIKRHEFFRGVVWEEVLAVSRPPFVPVGVEWEEGKEGVDVEKCVDEVFGEVVVGKCEGEVRNQMMSCDFDVF